MAFVIFRYMKRKHEPVNSCQVTFIFCFMTREIMPIFNGRPAQQNIKDIIINIRFTRLFFIQESRQVQVHHGGGEHDELEHGEQAGHGEEGHGGVPHDAGALPGRRQHLHI